MKLYTEIKTKHDIDITAKEMMLTLSPSLEYQNTTTVLDKKELFTLTTSTSESYYHNIDIIRQKATNSKRSTARTSYLPKSLILNYKLNSAAYNSV